MKNLKKLTSIIAVVLLSIGMFSCSEDNSTAETDALYENVVDTNGSDDENADPEVRRD